MLSLLEEVDFFIQKRYQKNTLSGKDVFFGKELSFFRFRLIIGAF